MEDTKWSAGERRAWNHYERTGVILPNYQTEIAERLAERADETQRERSAVEDRQRLQV